MDELVPKPVGFPLKRKRKGGNNASGRRRPTFNSVELQELLSVNVGKAIETIIAVMERGRVDNDRLKAAMFVLERVYGKAREVVEHGGRVEIAVNRPPAMSREEWLRAYGVGMKEIEAKPVELPVIDVTVPQELNVTPIEIEADPSLEVIPVHEESDGESIKQVL